MKVKVESENIGLKLNILKTKIMASGPISSWQIHGGNNGNSDRLYFFGLQNHCKMVIAAMKLRHLLLEKKVMYLALLGKKAMTNLGSLLKSRDITLPTKVHLVKAIVFPVVMYGCESWTIKKAEDQRIDAFELWCWRRLLRVPWTSGRSNQSILKDIDLNIH